MHYSALLAIVIVFAGALTVALILLSMPLLKSYAMARPNHRSSHRQPTPQGGGAAVMMATFLVAWSALALSGLLSSDTSMRLLAVTGACALLAAVGAIDDLRGLSLVPRLAAQFIAVGAVVLFAPEGQLVPALPAWMERVLIVVGGVWFVNLVNFMDGVDWMTVAEAVPIAGAIVVLGWVGVLPPVPMIVAGALLGAVFGFAPFNKPVARLFLGDVGSLPIGLLLGWLLLLLALRGHLAAAILLPLYYLADATLTLIARTARGERLWEAHRSHFYQRAVDGGSSVASVVARVGAVNLVLAALALISIRQHSTAASTICVALGAALVGLLLASFARPKTRLS